MPRYILAKSARIDLIDIWTYIAEQNIDAADNMLAEIQSAFDILASSPRIGHTRADLTKKDVRFWPVHNYLIVYQDTSPLEIVRVLSAFRNVTELLMDQSS